MKTFQNKVQNHKMIMTDLKETKAIKMKSKFIMPVATHDALKRNADISEAPTVSYSEFKKFVEANKGEILQGGARFKINVLTEEGWRGAKEFFGKNDNFKWFDPALHYDDERASIDEIYMIQIYQL